MKKNLKNLGLLLATVSLITFTSCLKEDEVQSLDGLQPVKFDNSADKVVSSIKTGKIVLNPATGVNEFEYLTSIEKQYTMSTVSVAGVSDTDVIYPGSILRGSSFLEATYNPLVISNTFSPVILSGTLQGNGTSFTSSVTPTLGAVRNQINIMKSQNTINYSAIPAVIEYSSEKVVNNKSYKKALETHINASGLFNVLSANFDTSSASEGYTNKSYTIVRLKQWFYNFSIDPKFYADWVTGPINITEFGTHEPVYVSSVDYGRVAYIRIENTESETNNQTMIKAAVGYAIPTLSAGISVTSTNQFKTLISNGKVKFMVVGGPVGLGQQVTDYDSFKAFVQQPNSQDLVNSSVPIGYKIRRLKDNTIVDVKDIYVKQLLELKSN